MGVSRFQGLEVEGFKVFRVKEFQVAWFQGFKVLRVLRL